MTFQPLYSETAGSGTTGVGTVFERRIRGRTVILISGALSESGTTSEQPVSSYEHLGARWLDSTASVATGEAAERPAGERTVTSQAISELRRISGLTWEQLAQLFGVSRRSVHFWASGNPMNARNEEHLMRVLDVVRAADRGDARSNRAALLDVREDKRPLDLLAEKRFPEATSRLGRGPGRRGPALGELSEAAKDARRPLKPEELIDARHDRVHRDLGSARAAKTARKKRRGTD